MPTLAAVADVTPVTVDVPGIDPDDEITPVPEDDTLPVPADEATDEFIEAPTPLAEAILTELALEPAAPETTDDPVDEKLLD